VTGKGGSGFLMAPQHVGHVLQSLKYSARSVTRFLRSSMATLELMTACASFAVR
jgi:hypothetical protein